MKLNNDKGEYNGNLTNGTEALTKLRETLKNQHGEEKFNESLKVARYERDLLDSITAFRKKNKVTQQDLADQIKTKAQQISKYERAEQTPSLSAILKVCDALGVEITLKSKEDQTVLFHT
jgi:ribosome-binding protein aMBF1 (putative translation factor)